MTLKKPVSNTPTATESHLGEVGGKTVILPIASFTRPTGTTQYAAQDVVGPVTTPAVLTFTGAGRITGGSGYVTKVVIAKSTVTITLASFRLWLYRVAPTAIADNSPWTLLRADVAKRLGYVDITMATGGTGSDSASGQDTSVRLPFQCDPASSSLFGVLVATAAYTPADSEIFDVEITVEQN